MNPLSRWIEYWDRKVRKFSLVDVKIAGIYSAALMLIVVKIFPEIMSVSVWWFVAVAVLCVLRLCYVIWIKDEGQPAAPGDAP